MKFHFPTSSLPMLVALALGTSNGWALLSGTGTRIQSSYEQELKDLERDLRRAVPAPDQRAKTAYREAREAEAAANEALKQAQQRQAKFGQAQGLVAHAKGKWIGGADKGIAQAKEKLKNAGSSEERKAAEAELAKWEKNKEEGLQALKERQALLDEAERDRPKAEKALKEAEKALAEAKARTRRTIEDIGLEALLTSDKLDASLAKYLFLKAATPRALATFAQDSRDKEAFLSDLLSDTDLLVRIAVADGAKDGQHGRALEIYHAIQQASDKAAEGPLQRLALAIALEHAVPVQQRNAVADTDAPATVDPVKRYLHYEKAFLAGELDPAFAQLTVWDLRMVVDGEEPDEIAAWGREMLRSYRPDHVTMDDYRWRYVALVRSDIPYGSQDNKYDRDDLQFFQNILMNGGVCGRRAFIGRFILRAFGIPTTARPQRGHAALVHWTPDGWVVCLGAGWGSGWTKTPYGDDLNFLATTQARATGPHYLRVQRAHWIGELMGEKRCYGFIGKQEPEFWNGVALYTQRALIEAAESQTLEAVGEDIAEASDSREKIEITEVEITDEDRKIRVDDDDVITIPAAATSEPTGSSHGILFLPSTLGGHQLHYSRGAGNRAFEYSVQAPEAGKYALVARVVTPSWQQNLMLTVNRADEPIRIPLPHTVGLWGATEPVAVELKRGRNTLHFTRSSDGSPKGFSLHEFKLVPWDLHLESPATFETPVTTAGESGMSSSDRDLLALTLLQTLARISSEGGLQPLPMDLSITGSKVRLLEAKGNGILAIQALEGGKIVPVALEDLKPEDHVLLARLAARLRPDDPLANALAGIYLESLGESELASIYRQKAGPEAVAQLEEALVGSPK